MKRRCALTAAAVMLSSVPAAAGHTLDHYRVRDNVSAITTPSPVTGMLCPTLPDARPLKLEDAIVRAICAHPQALKSWSAARARFAALGIADAAYLPTLAATAGYQRETQSAPDDSGKHGQIAESQTSFNAYGTLNMSWTLFDFGKRSAIQRQARALLSAANSVHDATLQAVLFKAVEAVYAVWDAQASVDGASRAESIARKSLAQATAKHVSGAGTRSDELQARASYRRATLERVNAEGHLRSVIGALCVALGLDANMPLRVAAEDREADEDALAHMESDVDELIESAKRYAPKLLAARANLDASRAEIDIARSQARPTIALVGSVARRNPGSASRSGSPASSGTVGIRMTIPLFDGLTSRYGIQHAEARAEMQEAELRDGELQVSLEVWSSYHDVRTSAANLVNSRDLLDDAQSALDMARGRYDEGVGTFTELLTAQSMLEEARNQRLRAISKWRDSRLRLAASLGRLGFWTFAQ